MLLDRLCAPRGPVFPCQRLIAGIDVVIGACPARRGTLECTSAPHSLAIALDSCALSEALLSALSAKTRVGTTAMSVTHFSLDPVFLGWSPAGNAWTFTARGKIKFPDATYVHLSSYLLGFENDENFPNSLPWSGCESGKTVLFRVSLFLCWVLSLVPFLVHMHDAIPSSLWLLSVKLLWCLSCSCEESDKGCCGLWYSSDHCPSVPRGLMKVRFERGSCLCYFLLFVCDSLLWHRLAVNLWSFYLN